MTPGIRLASLGRGLPQMRFPDPALRNLRNPLTAGGTGTPGGAGITGGGGFLANLAASTMRGSGGPRTSKIPKGLK